MTFTKEKRKKLKRKRYEIMDNILIENENNTEIAMIAGIKDIAFYTEKYMGNEFSDYVTEYFNDVVNEYDYENECLKEELQNYTGSLESNNCLLHDTVDTLEELIEYIETSKRITKEKILEKLKMLKINIWNEL